MIVVVRSAIELPYEVTHGTCRDRGRIPLLCKRGEKKTRSDGSQGNDENVHSFNDLRRLYVSFFTKPTTELLLESLNIYSYAAVLNTNKLR